MRFLLTYIIFFITFVSSAKSEEFSALFGLKLQDNVEEHFNLDTINYNKYKNTETVENFYDVDITNIIKKKSPQIETYEITLDNNSQIQGIYGTNLLDTIINCNERVMPSIITIFENKYSLNFEYFENSYTNFNIYSNQTYDYNGNLFRVQCNETIDGQVFLQIAYQSTELLDAVEIFYNQGF